MNNYVLENYFRENYVREMMNDGHLKMISYDKICDTESITVFQDLYKPQAKLVKYLAPHAAPAAVIIKSHHFSVAQNHDLA